jgi:hypothetical protein
VLRGVGVTRAAKRTQGAQGPRDRASKASNVRVGVLSFCADNTETLHGLASRSHRGQKNAAPMHWAPQEPGRSCGFRASTGGHRLPSPGPVGALHSPRSEQEQPLGSDSAKETKRCATGRRTSELLVVPMKQGNARRRTLWREGAASEQNREGERCQEHRILIPSQRDCSG